MRANHYVIRNGKLISKLQAQKLPSPHQQRLNIVRPYQIIRKNGDDKQHEQQEGSKTERGIVMKNQYEDLMKMYQKKIGELENEVGRRRLEAEEGYRCGKENQYERQRYRSVREKKTTGMPVLGKLRQLPSKYLNQGEKTITDRLISGNPMMDTFRTKPSQLAICEGNQQNRKQGLSIRNTINDEQKIPIQINCQQSNLIKNASLSTINTINENIEVQYPIPLTERQSSRQSNSYFDTTTLISRLNRSASLVKKIKKFLEEPAECGDESQIEASKNQINQQISQQQHQDLASLEQSLSQSELEQFLQQLLEKHEQVLGLTIQLQTEKDAEINELRRYYEDMINRKQQQINRKNIGYYVPNRNWGRIVGLNRCNKEKKKGECKQKQLGKSN